MINIANLPDNERNFLFQNTAEKIKLSDAIVEKDFWVCYMLDYLFNRSPWKNHLIFKGGTSLSKAFHLIERFSEDIDLIVDWRLLGYKIDEPWCLTRNHIDKKIGKNTYEFLSNQFIPTLQEGLSTELHKDINLEIQTHDHKNYVVNFYYPKSCLESSYIKPVVRLEIGMLAAWTPHENKTIMSYAAECYRNLFTHPDISIPTASPIRTFLEKATILHREATRPENKPIPQRYSRHYYDVYCMLQNTSFEQEVFKNIGLLSDVTKFSDKFYHCPWVDFNQVNTNNIKLIPPENRKKEITNDYMSMQEMIFGKKPSLENIFLCLAAFEKKLRNLESK